jgi:repressor LexA
MTTLPAKLTPRQEQIHRLIQQAIAETGAPPTRAEIAQILGFRSANAAEEHLQALARKGVIELVSGTSRGIRLRQRPAPQSNDQLDLPMGMGSLQWLPLVGRVAAGAPILAQEHVEARYPLPPELFRHAPDYLLRVRGQSMRDAGIQDGDLLAVKRKPNASNGQIVVARLDDEVTVKRYFHHTHGIELRAENPNFQPIWVDPSQAIVIEGLAVGLIRTDTL